MSWDIFNDHFLSVFQHPLTIPKPPKWEALHRKSHFNPVRQGLKQIWQVVEMLQGQRCCVLKDHGLSKKMKTLISEMRHLLETYSQVFRECSWLFSLLQLCPGKMMCDVSFVTPLGQAWQGRISRKSPSIRICCALRWIQSDLSSSPCHLVIQVMMFRLEKATLRKNRGYSSLVI